MISHQDCNHASNRVRKAVLGILPALAAREYGEPDVGVSNDRVAMLDQAAGDFVPGLAIDDVNSPWARECGHCEYREKQPLLERSTTAP